MDTNKKAIATMSTPDGLIKGTVKYNPQWRKFQVNIDGSLHGEFKTLEDGVEELKNAGFKNIKITENKMKKQPSSKLTPSQLRMKKVLKPIVEGILNEEDESYNYTKSELSRIKLDPVYSPKIQIYGGGGEKTKFMNLDSESVPVIIAWLKSIQSKLPR